MKKSTIFKIIVYLFAVGIILRIILVYIDALFYRFPFANTEQLSRYVENSFGPGSNVEYVRSELLDKGFILGNISENKFSASIIEKYNFTTPPVKYFIDFEILNDKIVNSTIK